MDKYFIELTKKDLEKLENGLKRIEDIMEEENDLTIFEQWILIKFACKREIERLQNNLKTFS